MLTIRCLKEDPGRKSMPMFLQKSFPTLVVRANLILVFLMIALLPRPARAQENQTSGQSSNDSSADLNQQVRDLHTLVEQLQKQVSDLQARVPTTQLAENVGNGPSAQVSVQAPLVGGPSQSSAASEPHGFDFLHGTTVNFLFDGYYNYNFNNPIGRLNLLRAYDVLSNAFSLNQADVVLE